MLQFGRDMVIDGVYVYGQASRRKAFVISYRLERIARSPSNIKYLLIGRERESSYLSSGTVIYHLYSTMVVDSASA